MIRGGNDEGCRFSRSIPRDLKRALLSRKRRAKGIEKSRGIGNAIFAEFQTYFASQTANPREGSPENRWSSNGNQIKENSELAFGKRTAKRVFDVDPRADWSRMFSTLIKCNGARKIIRAAAIFAAIEAKQSFYDASSLSMHQEMREIC